MSNQQLSEMNQPMRSRSAMRNDGWVIVVFENQHLKEVAYVKGPFQLYEQAEDWAETAEDCQDGNWQITFIENAG